MEAGLTCEKLAIPKPPAEVFKTPAVLDVLLDLGKDGPELAKIFCWNVADAAWGNVEEVVEHCATTG